ncbi:MAG: hypothetical protein LBU83_09105 [Bacteroidales bacterium]|jgi:hypothetical protein|nr:hypothetical protein [Bacteroidales bacterium]
MSTETKNKVISSFVTALVMLLLLFVLYFFRMYSQVPPPEPQKMILIELTSGGGGGGGSDMQRSAHNLASDEPNLATQEAEEAPEVILNSKNDNAVASESKLEPGATYSPGKGGGAGGGTGTGSGTGAGMGLGSGEGSGSGAGKGSGYGDGPRRYLNMPDVNVPENGKVYVEVHVTAQGNVISARILNSTQYPTTITNSQIQNECIKRALSAKYVNGKDEFRIILFQ